jgi:hypothetical protein
VQLTSYRSVAGYRNGQFRLSANGDPDVHAFRHMVALRPAKTPTLRPGGYLVTLRHIATPST